MIQLLLLTGAHCANHNIAHVKHMVLPWYHTTHAVYCVCVRACMSVSPTGETRDPKGVRHVRLPWLITPAPERGTDHAIRTKVRNDSPSSGMLDCPFSRPSVQASHQQCSPFHSLGFDPTWPLHTTAITWIAIMPPPGILHRHKFALYKEVLLHTG